MLGEGPTTYSMADMRDAMNMSLKLVASYGLSDAGVTLYAPSTTVSGFMKKGFEVSWPLATQRSNQGHQTLSSAPRAQLI